MFSQPGLVAVLVVAVVASACVTLNRVHKVWPNKEWEGSRPTVPALMGAVVLTLSALAGQVLLVQETIASASSYFEWTPHRDVHLLTVLVPLVVSGIAIDILTHAALRAQGRLEYQQMERLGL